MLKNYFLIAWRNISRHKIYTSINVLGLALGTCACLVIFLITRYEFSFDKFHPEKERIYRIVGDLQRSSGEKEFLNSVINEVAGFQNQIPGFEQKAGFYSYGPAVTIPDGNKPVKKFDNRIEGSWSSSTILTWPQYFEIFKYQWLDGNAQSLKEPFRVVLTEKRARKYFGDIPISKMMGRKVIYDDSLQVSVSGIVKDWVGNTDFGYSDFISISTATHSFLKNQIPTEDWTVLNPHRSMAFVKLAKGTTASQINKRFAAFIKERVKFGDGTKLSMYLQPLNEIHFTSDFHRLDDGDDFRKPYLPTLYALMGLAFFILIIAAVNFINLSTALSIQRSKEIGVRKVLGSNKAGIVFQFLTETLVLTLFAIVASVVMVKPVLSAFSAFLPEGVSFHPFEGSTLIFIFLVTIITALLAGLYPARVLSSYAPALSLKGAVINRNGGGLTLRRGLIVFQFSISLIFIIGAIVIGKQIQFMNNADKGFNSNAIVTVNNWGDRGGKTKVFAEGIKHIAGIEKVILQGVSPMGFAHGGENFKYKGKNEIDLPVSFDAGSDDFIPFYQMKMIAGRNLKHSDSLNELVINETCSKAMGFSNPQDAVGQLLYRNNKPYPVVGVIADFQENSYHEAMKPVVIAKMPEREWSVAFKLTGGEKKDARVKAILAQVEDQWKKLYPDSKVNYSFLNESITWLFEQEKKTAWLVNIAMAITIFISCMGLFGLGMYTAERRTKEIGIRKVLGASVVNIVSLLNSEFVKLILISVIIASPIAWYLTTQWLQDFVYRTEISWWIFLSAGLSAILIALVTVSFQAFKAAFLNPAKTMRTE